MPEGPTTYTLERLYHRIAELEADLRLANANIEYLERVTAWCRESSYYRRGAYATLLPSPRGA